MKFSRRITDHVQIAWIRGRGTVAIVLDDWLFPLLNLTKLSYKKGHSTEEVKHYVGVQLCNYLKNRTSKESILNDHWMNQYLEKVEIAKAIDTVTVNAADVMYEGGKQ